MSHVRSRKVESIWGGNVPAPDFDQLCDALEVFESEKAKAEQSISHVKGLMIQRLREQGVNHTTTNQGRKVTLVEPIKTSWNQDILRDILGPLWPEVVVVKEILDQSKLEHVCDRERIPTESLQDAVVETEIKPYVKVTSSKAAS